MQIHQIINTKLCLTCGGLWLIGALSLSVLGGSCERNYENPNYGYKVKIPLSVEIYTSPPPLPNHGVKILFPDAVDSSLLLNAEYNAADWTVEEHLDSLLKTESNQETVEWIICRGLVHIDKRTALHVNAIGKNTDRIIESIHYLRERKEEDDIIYSIILYTSRKNYTNTVRVFDKIINSFRFQKLP